jgi:hypothetical protein
VQSREHVPAAAPRRAANPQPSRGGKPKAGFTIAASTVASDDEDDWISSESGAATPLDNASGDEDSGKKTPREQSPTTPVDTAGQRANVPNPALVPGTTPRAEPPPSRPRVQTNGFVPSRPPHVATSTARIPSSSKQLQYPQQEQESYRQRLKQLQLQPDKVQHASHQAPPQQSPQPPTPPSLILGKALSPQSPPHTPEAAPVVSGARTEPPTPTSPRSGHYPSSRARPSSARSLIADYAHHLRPHPLIRGQSFGHGHLAPLKVSSDAAQAQLSSSPPNRATSTSPTSIRTIHTPSHTPSPGAHFSSAIFRRPSTSSARSAATLPIQSYTPSERGRTYSTVSTASTSAALSSLVHLPTRGTVPPAQNAPLVVHFPLQNPHAHPEAAHALLPPPYVTPHFTILQWHNPIRESHDRVARAREVQCRGRRGA